MAGRGPAPKTKNKGQSTAVALLRSDDVVQPDLGARQLPGGVDWCDQTRDWWEMWAGSPQAEQFSATDWDFLLDTALVHHSVWSFGDMSLLGELRIRVAKFGATPEDRARLKWQFAVADKADADAKKATGPVVQGEVVTPAEATYAGLALVSDEKPKKRARKTS